MRAAGAPSTAGWVRDQRSPMARAVESGASYWRVGQGGAPQERIERQARQLLQCYGIVTRESLRSWEQGETESGWIGRRSTASFS